MLKQADRMASMVDDLFELSRIHAGTLNLCVQPLALRDVVSECIAGASPVAAAGRVGSTARSARTSRCAPTPTPCRGWWATS